MTKAQDCLHWRRWGAVVAANGWRMEAGRLADDARRTESISIFHRLVWRAATALALTERRAITADDLRHACYATATTSVPGWGARAPVATGMKQLGNREFSRLLCLWGDCKAKAGLLIEPDCIESSMCWDDPERDAGESMERTLKKMAPAAVLGAISANAFGTREWETLDASQKRWIFRAVKERKEREDQHVGATP